MFTFRKKLPAAGLLFLLLLAAAAAGTTLTSVSLVSAQHSDPRLGASDEPSQALETTANLIRNGDFSNRLAYWSRNPTHKWVGIRSPRGNPAMATWPWNGYEVSQGAIAIHAHETYTACIRLSTTSSEQYRVVLRLQDGTGNLGLEQTLRAGHQCFIFTASRSAANARLSLMFGSLKSGGVQLNFDNISLTSSGGGGSGPTITPTATIVPGTPAAAPTSTPGTPPASGAGNYKIEIGPNQQYVVLENSDIRVVYGSFFENHAQFAIREFNLKRASNQNQAGSKYLDADAGRGPLLSARLVTNTASRKTVRLEWYNRTKTPGVKIIHEVTIYPSGPFLELNYVNVQAGTNVVDIGRPGGTSNGRHVAYGASAWIRGYVTQTYAPTVGSYYNRFRGDRVNDPADGGSLNYHGDFIVGVLNPANGVGFGRVMPVSAIEIVKLLLSPTSRRGLELFPYPFGRPHPPFTGYLYGVTGGQAELLAVGKKLADR